ncbi:MAG: prolyl oligopeptidase family serine peptidase [Phycisphaerae bacterium]|nr:prolyl oligopeptidase family serine peptidase [Phycisphaerae bacterium]
MNKEKSYCVVLPKGYDKDKAGVKGGWPVLFLFHGRGRTERSLIDDDKTRKAILEAPFVVVLLDGDDGWYINSPVKPSDKYEDYTEEVINHADNLYCLNPNRKYRSLSGWSMGGYGCTHFAETHSEKYSAVVPIIGLLDFPRNGLPKSQSYEVPAKRFGNNTQTWKSYNPIYKAKNLQNTSILIIAADKAFDRTMNENFSSKLKVLKIDHELKILSGGHDFDVVQESIPIVIDFITSEYAKRKK